MNKVNMTLHKLCAIVKEMSVHNGNIHVHQAPFSDGTASNKRKKNLTCVTEYMYEVKVFNKFSSGFYKMSVRTDSVDQDQTAQTVLSDVGFTLSVNLWDIFLPNI